MSAQNCFDNCQLSCSMTCGALLCLLPSGPPATPPPHPPNTPSPHRPPPLPNSDLIHPDDLLTKGSKSRDKSRDRRGPKDRKKGGHVMEGPEKRGPRPRVDELLVGALCATLTLHLHVILHYLWVLSYVFRCWLPSQHIMCSSQCFTEFFRMEGIIYSWNDKTIAQGTIRQWKIAVQKGR